MLNNFIMDILRTQHLIMIVSQAAEHNNKKTIRLAIGLGWVGPAQHGNRKRDKKPDESQGTTHPHIDERAA